MRVRGVRVACADIDEAKAQVDLEEQGHIVGDQGMARRSSGGRSACCRPARRIRAPAAGVAIAATPAAGTLRTIAHGCASAAGSQEHVSGGHGEVAALPAAPPPPAFLGAHAVQLEVAEVRHASRARSAAATTTGAAATDTAACGGAGGPGSGWRLLLGREYRRGARRKGLDERVITGGARRSRLQCGRRCDRASARDGG